MIEISVRAIVIAGEITSPIVAPAMTLDLSFTSFFAFNNRWIVGSVASPVWRRILRSWVPGSAPVVPLRGAAPPTFRFAFAFAALILDLSFEGWTFTFPFPLWLVSLFLSTVRLDMTFLPAVVTGFIFMVVHRERSVWWFIGLFLWVESEPFGSSPFVVCKTISSLLMEVLTAITVSKPGLANKTPLRVSVYSGRRPLMRA
jgi:hypothetical protein